MLLEMEDVRVFRGTNRVLDEFSLRISASSNTAIIGPNGAGKSTLLKLLTRELYPSEGSMKILGRQRWNIWELRNRLGLVSADLQQDYCPTATGWAVILSGYYASNDIFSNQVFDAEMLKTANILVQQLDLVDLVDRPFAKMSTGQQRRFLLARALVNDPEVLVLDEPTTGLDLQAQFRYHKTTQQLMASGKTILLVTHHVHEILPEIDRVVLMKNGQVVDHDEKANALTNEKLSSLFETSLKVVRSDGYFHVQPAS